MYVLRRGAVGISLAQLSIPESFRAERGDQGGGPGTGIKPGRPGLYLSSSNAEWMRDPLQQAREAAANARISDQEEPDWRRVRWAMERYLEASQQNVVNLRQRIAGSISTAELKFRVEAVSESLTRTRAFIWQFMGDTLVNNAPPKCLETFFEGLRYLEQLYRTDNAKNADLAIECFKAAVEDLNLLVYELGDMDPGDDVDGGAGWPSPTTPKPTLTGKDAKPYPPVDQAD